MISTYFVLILGGGNDQAAVFLFIQFKPPFMGSLDRVHITVCYQLLPLFVDTLVKFIKITIPVGKIMGFTIWSVPWADLSASPADATLFIQDIEV